MAWKRINLQMINIDKWITCFSEMLTEDREQYENIIEK